MDESLIKSFVSFILNLHVICIVIYTIWMLKRKLQNKNKKNSQKKSKL